LPYVLRFAPLSARRRSPNMKSSNSSSETDRTREASIRLTGTRNVASRRKIVPVPAAGWAEMGIGPSRITTSLVVDPVLPRTEVRQRRSAGRRTVIVQTSRRRPLGRPGCGYQSACMIMHRRPSGRTPASAAFRARPGSPWHRQTRLRCFRGNALTCHGAVSGARMRA
jgi:hypothetical protein